MRKKIISTVMATVLLFSVSMTNTSCIGSFALTQKVHSFNQNLGNKFVQELGFILMIVIPVYEVAAVIDALVINTIEFWSGNNPMAMNEGDIQKQYVEIDGKEVEMTATKGHMTVVEANTDNPAINIEMSYNEATSTWDVYSSNELSHSVTILNENGDVELVKDGEVVAQFNLNSYDRANLAMLR